MAKQLRVHNLAKELGVKSKAIVEKCEAEGVPGITNHMSVVKLGLAETIRQWFADAAEGGDAEAEAEAESHDHGEESHGGTATAVETAEKVDAARVRAKARKRAKAKAKPKAGEADTGDRDRAAPPAGGAKKKTPAAAPEPEPEPSATPAEAESTEPQTPAQTPKQPPDQAPPVAAESQPPADPAAAAESPPGAKQPIGPVGQQNVPQRPDVIKPVGQPLDKPQTAKLRGPKVVRVEQPEPAPAPRRKGPAGGQRGGGGGGGEKGTNLPTGEAPGFTRSRGPARGRGAGGGFEEPESPKKRQRRGGMNTRRGRSGDALPTGPSKFSQADMEELDARLKGSSGYLKQRRRDLRKRESQGGPAQTAVQTGGKVEVQEPLTIKGLSAATGIKTADIIKYLFTEKKAMATINSAIDPETAMEVALEYNIELEVKEQQTAQQQVEEAFETQQEIDVKPRPPVVTVLGHVDHGKTSLLDKIRRADVAAHEAGGITQHVGAYRVTVEGDDSQEKTVVFLDTPGHEAFTTMRSRGAQLTDLVVLVVAADDGVMPQTIESINHAKAAGVPIIVALNKIDKPEATDENIHRIYGQLAEHGLNPVDWGGETEILRTSAENNTGVTDLLDVLDYQAELLELQADYGGPARGTVIEAEMQPGRGAVARVLIRQGRIKVGDFINIGRAYGRVREMSDDRGRALKEAGPATPLEVSGIDEVPDAGDKLYVTDSLKRAEDIARQFRETERQKQLASQTKVTLDNFAETLKAGQVNLLRVVLKADVQGSMETLRTQLEDLGNDEVAVRVLHAAVGGVTESDVVLADASDAIVIGFQVSITPAVREIADERKVDVRQYRVIYELLDDVKKALEGMLTPETHETELGRADVKEVFRISKLGNIAGCLVSDGAMRNDAKLRVVRDGVVVADHRKVASLRRVKDEVKEVRAGTECGIHVEGFDDLKAGDEIIAYRVEEIARKLE